MEPLCFEGHFSRVKSPSTEWAKILVNHKCCKRLIFRIYKELLQLNSKGDPPKLVIEPGSPALQADSLLSEPPRKPLTLKGFVGYVGFECVCVCDHL